MAADDTADDAAEDAVDDAADGSTASRQFIVESSRSIQIAIKIIVSTVARLLNNVSLHLLPISKDLLEELCNTSSRSFGALPS